MNYLNLEISKLNSAEVIGSDPTERGTWLMLQAYCASQENGGRIAGCRSWSDRKWQQIVRVTLKEVNRECDLWAWDGDDLVVWEYPADQEDTLRRKREGGSKGGRPKKPSDKPQDNHEVSEQQTTRPSIAETESNRKGKEGKGKEKELSPLPPPPSGGKPGGESVRGAFDDLIARINSLRAEWGKPAAWSYAEQQSLFGGASAQMQELSEDDWALLKDFLGAHIPDAKAFWQPRSRTKFCETFADTWQSAQRWASKPGNGPLPKTRDTRW